MSSAIFLLGAGLQCGASSSTGLGIMYAGRIIVGLAIGIASNLAVCLTSVLDYSISWPLQPIYVAEIAPPAIRGRLIGMYEFCWQVGGVIGILLVFLGDTTAHVCAGFWINYGVTQHIAPSHKQWFIAFAVQLIVCPSSKYFLLDAHSNSPEVFCFSDRFS